MLKRVIGLNLSARQTENRACFVLFSLFFALLFAGGTVLHAGNSSDNDSCRMMHDSTIIRIETGDLVEAARWSRKAILSDCRSYSTYYNAGWVALNQDSIVQALGYFTLAVNQSPERAAAFSNRAYCLLKLGKSEVAASDYEAALKADSEHEQALIGRLITAIYEGNNDLIKTLSDQMSAQNEPVASEQLLAAAALYSGEAKQALFNLDQDEAATDSDTVSSLIRALSYYRLGGNEQSILEMQSLLENSYSDSLKSMYLYYQGRNATQIGDAKAALKMFSGVFDRQHRQAADWQSAQLLYQVDSVESARSILTKSASTSTYEEAATAKLNQFKQAGFIARHWLSMLLIILSVLLAINTLFKK